MMITIKASSACGVISLPAAFGFLFGLALWSLDIDAFVAKPPSH